MDACMCMRFWPVGRAYLLKTCMLSGASVATACTAASVSVFSGQPQQQQQLQRQFCWNIAVCRDVSPRLAHEMCRLEEECLDVVSPAVLSFRMPTGSKTPIVETELSLQ
mmetsp:Transcript_96694/g.311655  ORF Transcript_96694/g.311655 Transcript_96694/m.311655 type:complete len:109 (-) Transcript_96694:321-647(-)